jgi:hypothetical protein
LRLKYIPTPLQGKFAMTVCPIAIAVGCQKCPAFKICPAKSILGDQPKGGASTTKETGKSSKK